VELFVGYLLIISKLSELLQKSGTLGHGILNDILEEFGEGDDSQDATSMLYLGKYSSSMLDILYKFAYAYW
jgi:hypothetical protein